MKKQLILLLLSIGFINAILAQHDRNSANAYMHKSSEEELIQSFESEERDAYQHPEKVLKYLGKIKGKSIMDLGAGSGYFSIRLAKTGAKVISADVNEKFQAYLKERITKEKISNLELRKIPYDNPMLEAEEVDLVLTVNTYHHIENRSEYFSKVKSGIKKGGELIIIDFFKAEIPVGPPNDHKVSIDEVISELKEAGYKDFTIDVNLLPYQFIIKAK